MDTNAAAVGIKAWPVSERPRERLLAGGAKALSDAELLAVLFRSGIKGKDAVSLSRELLAKTGGLRKLLSSEEKDLKKEKGLGAAKIASLLAAKELVKRSLREEILGKNVVRESKSLMICQDKERMNPSSA